MESDASIRAKAKREVLHREFAAHQDESISCAAFRKLADAVPDVLPVHLDLVHFASRACEYGIARAAARRLLKNFPENPAAVESAALVLARFGHVEEAVAGWLRLARQPRYQVFAWTSLATLAERGQQMGEASDWISQALRIAPGDTIARITAAGFYVKARRREEALTALHPLIAPGIQGYLRVKALYLWGDLHDAMGDAPTAAAAWQEAKACCENHQAKEIAHFRAIHTRGRARRQRNMDELTRPERLRRWMAQAPVSKLPPLTLLIGHPRSGTTLLEQVLAAHPRVVNLDEENAISVGLRNKLFKSPVGVTEFERLDAASPADLAATRQDYRRRVVLLRTLQADSVILDKNPNLTDTAPYLFKPFPELRLLVARRDPRDIVLSCYRQMVGLDSGNVSWLSQQDLAADCATLLEGWECLRDALGPAGNWKEVRYEDLCEDFPTVARGATEFMGLDWHPDQANYRSKQTTKRVASPTYAAVRAPVHTSAIGRWTRYADLLPDLFAPWMR
jgi:Sulfotransferase family